MYFSNGGHGEVITEKMQRDGCVDIRQERNGVDKSEQQEHNSSIKPAEAWSFSREIFFSATQLQLVIVWLLHCRKGEKENV